MANMDRLITLLYKTPEGELISVFPKTLASQVVLSDGHTLEDHVNDTDKHLLSTEKYALQHSNQAEGYVVLDENGLVPMELINPEILAINTQFDTIDDMLENSQSLMAGALVMVMDASADPAVNAGWAIYRKLPSEEYWSLANGWQKVSESESLDVITNWDEIVNLPNSTTSEIDTAVEKSHTHENRTILAAFGNDEDDNLFYGARQVYFKEDHIDIFEGEFRNTKDRKEGDLFIKRSFGELWWDDKNIEEALADCGSLYIDRTDLTTAPIMNTKNTTSCNQMFSGCTSLKSTIQYDLRNCTDLSYQYYGCSDLLEAPPMNSLNCTNFRNQFTDCHSLETVGEIDYSSALNVSEQFLNCINLKDVVISGSTENVTDMTSWFMNDQSLTHIFGEIDFSSITDELKVRNIFEDCYALEEVRFTPYTLHVSISLAGTNLSAKCIERIILALPTITNSLTIDFSGIPGITGVSEERWEDAETRGWTVIK